MERDILQIIDMRKVKRHLYMELLKKGFCNLTESEKKLLGILSTDEDIILFLSNGGLVTGNEKNVDI